MTNFVLALILAAILVSLPNKVLAEESNSDYVSSSIPPEITPILPTATLALDAATASVESIIFSMEDKERKEAWLKEQDKIPFEISDANKCAAYLGDMKRRMRRAWFPPADNDGAKVIVTFTLGANGKISNVRLKRSSKREVCDQAALKAVENGAPFAPFPIEAPAKLGVEVLMGGDDYRGMYVKPKFVED